MPRISDPLTEKALKLIADQIDAASADIEHNRRQMVVDVERHHELMDRRKQLVRLYQMHGGDAAQVVAEVS